jgi:hypothetical protein
MYMAKRGRRPLETGPQNPIKAVEIRLNSLPPWTFLLLLFITSSSRTINRFNNSNPPSSSPHSTFPRQSHIPRTMKFFKSIAFVLPLFAAFASAAPAVEQREVAVVSDRQLTQLPLTDALEGVLDKIVRIQAKPVLVGTDLTCDPGPNFSREPCIELSGQVFHHLPPDCQSPPRSDRDHRRPGTTQEPAARLEPSREPH